MRYVCVPTRLDSSLVLSSVQQVERYSMSTEGIKRSPEGDRSNHRPLHTFWGLCKSTNLQREYDIVHNLLSREADIWRITTIEYDAGLKLLQSEGVRGSSIDRLKDCIRQMEDKIRLERQETFHIQCGQRAAAERDISSDLLERYF